MSDILEATKVEVPTYTIEGVERKFRSLTVYNRAEIQAADRKARKALLKESLDMAAVSPEDKFCTLQGFDKHRPDEQDWVDYVNLPESSGPIFAASLERTYPGEGEKIARQFEIDTSESFRLRAKLAGLVIKSAEPSGEDTRTFGDGGDDPNVKTPTTFSTPPAEETKSTGESAQPS